MAEKSGSGITGSHVLVLAGVLLLGAAVYDTWFSPPTEPQISEVVRPGEVEKDPEPTELAVQDDVNNAVPDVPKEKEDVAADDAAPVPPEETSEPAVAAQNEAETNTVAPVEEATASAPEPTPPSFDLVRVDPQGSAVIAGSAPDGAVVRIMDGAEVLAETVADGSGKFVALFDLPPSQEPRSISIEADSADGSALASTGTVLIAATAAPEVADAPEAPALVAEAASDLAPVSPAETADDEQLAVANPPAAPAAADPVEEVQIVTVAPKTVTVSPDPATETDAGDAVAVVSVDSENTDQPDTPQVEVAEAKTNADPELAGETELASVATSPSAPSVPETPEQPVSPAVVLADESGVRVLQPAPQPIVPSDDPVSAVSNLVIDTITYNTAGDVALGGRGAPQSFARIYVNDQAVQTVQIEADGSWAAPLPDIDAGVYRLRIDEVNADGTVTSRVETPFQREEPEVAALVAQRPNAVVVEKGFTLWAIAEDSFGSGFEYVRVYEANRDLIRDPDLIYPGQVFRIPEGLQSDDG